MARLFKVVAGGILLFSAFELGRISKAFDQIEENLFERLKNGEIITVNFEEVKK